MNSYEYQAHVKVTVPGVTLPLKPGRPVSEMRNTNVPHCPPAFGRMDVALELCTEESLVEEVIGAEVELQEDSVDTEFTIPYEVSSKIHLMASSDSSDDECSLPLNKHTILDDVWVSKTKKCCQCWECGKTFTKLELLMEHFRTHKSEMHCNLCSVTFQRKVSLRLHLENVHNNIILSCDPCNLTFCSKWEFNRHLTDHDPPYSPRTPKTSTRGSVPRKRARSQNAALYNQNNSDTPETTVNLRNAGTGVVLMDRSGTAAGTPTDTAVGTSTGRVVATATGTTPCPTTASAEWLGAPVEEDDAEGGAMEAQSLNTSDSESTVSANEGSEVLSESSSSGNSSGSSYRPSKCRTGPRAAKEKANKSGKVQSRHAPERVPASQGKCPLCKKSAVDIKQHLATCRRPKNTYCFICMAMYSSQKKLMEHKMKYHTSFKPSRMYACDACRELFPGKPEYLRHRCPVLVVPTLARCPTDLHVASSNNSNSTPNSQDDSRSSLPVMLVGNTCPPASASSQLVPQTQGLTLPTETVTQTFSQDGTVGPECAPAQSKTAAPHFSQPHTLACTEASVLNPLQVGSSTSSSITDSAQLPNNISVLAQVPNSASVPIYQNNSTTAHHPNVAFMPSQVAGSVLVPAQFTNQTSVSLSSSRSVPVHLPNSVVHLPKSSPVFVHFPNSASTPVLPKSALIRYQHPSFSVPMNLPSSAPVPVFLPRPVPAQPADSVSLPVRLPETGSLRLSNSTPVLVQTSHSPSIHVQISNFASVSEPPESIPFHVHISKSTPTSVPTSIMTRIPSVSPSQPLNSFPVPAHPARSAPCPEKGHKVHTNLYLPNSTPVPLKPPETSSVPNHVPSPNMIRVSSSDGSVLLSSPSRPGVQTFPHKPPVPLSSGPVSAPLTILGLYVNLSQGLSMQPHLAKSWRSKGVFLCRQCGAVSRQPSHSVRHRYLHRGLRRHRCLCGRTFLHRLHLLRHHIHHAETTRFVCAPCGRTFAGARCLARHKQGKGRGTGKRRRRDCRAPFSCDCGQRFSKPAAFLWHKLNNAASLRVRNGLCHS